MDNETKNSFFKTHRKIIITVSIVVVVVIGLLFAALSIFNSIKADNIKNQLNGMVFEYYSEDKAYNKGGYYTWEFESFNFNKESYTVTNWSVNQGRLNVTDRLDQVVKTEDKYDTEIDISLFGKATINGYMEVIIVDGKITGLKSSSGEFYTPKKTSDLEKTLSEKGVHEKLDSITGDTIFSWCGDYDLKIIGSWDYDNTTDTTTAQHVSPDSPYITFLTFNKDGTGKATISYNDILDVTTNFKIVDTSWEYDHEDDGVLFYNIYAKDDINEKWQVAFYGDVLMAEKNRNIIFFKKH